ncbi:error-prone DNA polymerase [Boudabousia marimammalium]|uniref:Error-prone DNA polymerase n=1 Tax=Boudabousia marimammalium TaxID=156892 RepID=A0A1Q5PRD1_9ACTO|nr:error-prone DNA polymerase [Boudabousia marimammalium]OKL50049.1 hypothetical protein BM477_03965 [Boudabousia marimammalium]
MFDYSELHAHSAYSFLDGVATPRQLAEAAAKAQYAALAITDHNGLYAVIQQYEACKEQQINSIYGAELTLENGSCLPVLATGPEGYKELSRTITVHNLAAGERKAPSYSLSELSGDWFVLTGTRRGPLGKHLNLDVTTPSAETEADLGQLIEQFGKDRLGIELNLSGYPGDAAYARQLNYLSEKYGLPLIATGAIRITRPEQVPLADLMQAAQLGKPLVECQSELPARRNFVRSKAQLARLYRDYPQALHNAGRFGAQLAFDLANAWPQLPRLKHLDGVDDATYLRQLVIAGATRRYGNRAEAPAAWELIEKELNIITGLGFCGYFLIVHDIVQWCEKQEILCQGRGSAANSAVCYALGITAVDAVRHKMLFERFLSPDRKEYPDIDLDIESGRREEAIQYVYRTYGRQQAAQVANIITLRPKSAIRLTAAALGYSETEISRFTHLQGHRKIQAEKLPAQVARLSKGLLNLPRHVGIHSGGMVLADRPIPELVPIQWAAKENRTVVQWDKEDCAAAGLVKFDLLGLGMLTALKIAFSGLAKLGIKGERGQTLSLHSIGQDDPKVYDLLCAGDTIGVFQVESRAQINMLPQLQPRCFYDIVVEVALVRPGPIQGQTVHPYLRRRRGEEAVTYPHEAARPVVEKTLGIPLFQEQLMQLAVVLAGFTPKQADELRRAMGSKRGAEKAVQLRNQLRAGFQAKGISAADTESLIDQFESFAYFGFPESHAFSFAYIVYASAWLKAHYPAFFYAAVLASQPMGFYSPATLVQDARRHEVVVEPVDVQYSELEATASLPDEVASQGRIRLGLHSVKGLGKGAERIVQNRKAEGPFQTVEELASRARLSVRELEKLALAGALESLGVSRRQGLWEAGAVGVKNADSWYQAPLPGTAAGAYAPELAALSESELLRLELQNTSLALSSHPMKLLRAKLLTEGCLSATELKQVESGTRIKVAGVITHRQRPATANGVTFLSLEDETGLVNVLCTPGMWKKYAKTLETASALLVRGICDWHAGAHTILADQVRALTVPIGMPARNYA